MDVTLTVQILRNPSASKIATPLPYFMKFKFLLMVKSVLLVPLYSPDAIMIVSPSWSWLLFKASFSVLNADASLLPSPLLILLALTYQLFPSVNNSSLDTLKVSVSFTIEFILLSIILTSLLTEAMSLVELSSALTVEIVNKQMSITKNKYRFFNIFSPLKN